MILLLGVSQASHTTHRGPQDPLSPADTCPFFPAWWPRWIPSALDAGPERHPVCESSRHLQSRGPPPLAAGSCAAWSLAPSSLWPSIFPDHNDVKREVSHRKRNEEKIITWRLNNMRLKKASGSTRKSKRELKSTLTQ
ncbi:uncharacterized protein AAG666_002801 [Megaptera novaeangliae]